MSVNEEKNQGGLYKALSELNRKLDDLITSLPDKYVSSRQHDLQYGGLDRRVTQLESWRDQYMRQQDQEHEDLRNNWQKDVKEVKDDVKEVIDKMNNMSTDTTRIQENFRLLIKILLWLLGLISAVVVAVLTAYLTQFLK